MRDILMLFFSAKPRISHGYFFFPPFLSLSCLSHKRQDFPLESHSFPQDASCWPSSQLPWPFLTTLLACIFIIHVGDRIHESIESNTSENKKKPELKPLFGYGCKRQTKNNAVYSGLSRRVL